ncbi:MAG: DNA gyrase subunit A, partial [Bacteroidales bacterium]|nr:DNA gyrase subunit A [Bacteroidales bacterium]
LQAEYDVLMKNIAYYKEVLSDVNLQMQIIKDETLEIKAKYGDARRSEITLAEGDFNPEDFYPDEDVVVTISHMGYIKRTSLAEYRTQARGGVGAKGSATKDEDFIEHLFVANMHATVLFFTENGRCFWSKVYNIPEGAKTSKGRALANFLELGDDKIKAYIAVKNLNDEEYINNHYVVLVTTQGIIKKTTLEAYSRPRSAGVRAINIREDDHLLSAVLTTGHNQILLASYEGLLVRFEEEKVRPMGKTATGVKGMTIEGDNRLVGVISYDPSDEASRDQSVLVISEHGYGKRTDFDEYRITNRGGKGVRTINITEKTGKLIAIASVTDANDLMLITRTGLTIRLNLSEVHLAGRATQGVKLINLRDTDSLASASVVEHSSEEEQTEVAAAETEPIVNE